MAQKIFPEPSHHAGTAVEFHLIKTESLKRIAVDLTEVDPAGKDVSYSIHI